MIAHFFTKLYPPNNVIFMIYIYTCNFFHFYASFISEKHIILMYHAYKKPEYCLISTPVSIMLTWLIHDLSESVTM